MRRTLIALTALLVTAPAASAQERHEHSANMSHVKNLPYATAIVMGAPALVKEGVSWREVRLRALHSTPVSLAARRPVHSHTDS